MKAFKNILAVIILFSVSCSYAKRTGAAATPVYTRETQPAIAPITPSTPSKPLTTSAAQEANAAINMELGKIEKSQNVIRDRAYSVLDDATISIADKDKFMNKVKSAYDVMNESSAEGYTELLNKLRQLKE